MVAAPVFAEDTTGINGDPFVSTQGLGLGGMGLGLGGVLVVTTFAVITAVAVAGTD